MFAILLSSFVEEPVWRNPNLAISISSFLKTFCCCLLISLSRLQSKNFFTGIKNKSRFMINYMMIAEWQR